MIYDVFDGSNKINYNYIILTKLLYDKYLHRNDMSTGGKYKGIKLVVLKGETELNIKMDGIYLESLTSSIHRNTQLL